MLDVVRLRILAAVASEGSLTAAARALHYSQPSVSHHLARLEAETGARRLQRVGRGVRLTAEGELWPAGPPRSSAGWTPRRPSSPLPSGCTPAECG